MQTKPNNGFLIVATNDIKYLKSAIFLADSIKDFYPESHITLFTEADWVRDVPYELFDAVHYNDFYHHRTKLYALSQTPYDLTCYLDADMFVEHEDICSVFGLMEDDKDIMMTNIRPYNGKITKFEGGELTHHCGMFFYRKNAKTINFMKEWWDLYQKQMSGEWQWDTNLYSEKLRPWDQWTFWWLNNKTNHRIRVGIFEDDARWNFVTGYKSDECKGPIVLRHERLT